MLEGYQSDRYCTFAYQREFYDTRFTQCERFKAVSDCLQARIERPRLRYSAKFNKQLLDNWYALPESQTWKSYMHQVIPLMIRLIGEYNGAFSFARVLGRQASELLSESSWSNHVIDAVGDRLFDLDWDRRYQRLHFPTAFHWLVFLTEGGELVPFRDAASKKTAVTIGGIAQGKYVANTAGDALEDREVRVLALKLGGRKQREIEETLQLRAPQVVSATQDAITKIISNFDAYGRSKHSDIK